MLPRRHPLFWIPSLYFAQGLPYAIVMTMAAIMYKRLGVSNEQIAWCSSLLGMAWVVKPLWSPLLELAPSKKWAIVTFQAVGGACLLAAALTLRGAGFFTFSVAALALLSLASASHDIAADGLYIGQLTPRQQAMYSGWLGTFWNGGKLFVQGAVVVLAGELEARYDARTAWAVALALPGAALLLLAAYHGWAAPADLRADPADAASRQPWRTSADVLLSFFRKPGIWLAIVFVLLFRVAEGQVQTIGRLFLIDDRAHGGLGMSTLDMGIAYGSFSTVAYIAGSILGGYFGAWRGLRLAMPVLILAMNLPTVTFCYLSVALPDNLALITAVLSAEMFGFGFGFAGLVMYMMQVVAPGKYPAAHYALGTGVMQLGLVLSTMVSGKIQASLGYHDFFIWGLLAALPSLLLTFVVALPGKPQQATLATGATP
ncbi:MFS transporter [Pseudoduganella danionis]|uniref:MFS transporter n=1 Tax=Pseudoduganella danionis TaxID=1890295 RepID=A0ABW9SUD4_9BURK|nr:MFS transporter [Pseudoduganella danionis]MTW35475.1 MFS transporter [Pseudoduganella danionis]